MTKHHKTHTCIIYYLSVDFCFSIRSFGLSSLFLFPPLPPSCGMNARKKEMAMINTKERLLSFFSASATTGMPVFFFGKAGNGRCAEAEKESTIEKERKTYLTNLLVYFLVFLSIIPYHMSLQKHKFC